jgi:pilus assembly protein CpaB
MIMLKSKVIIPLALLCSVGAAYIGRDYINELRKVEPKTVEEPIEQSVLITNFDLEIGRVISEEDLTVKMWPLELAPEGSFSELENLVGRVVRTEILAGEPIIERKLAPEGSIGGLSGRIPVGKVAMTVGVNVVSGVSGFIVPGCRVDVIVTTSTNYSKESAKTKIILQNVEVIAIDQETERDSNSPLSVQAVTLVVTPDEAEKLALASTEGKLQLILRNTTDSLEYKTRGTTLGQLIQDPKPKYTRPTVRRSTPKPVEKKETEHKVEVFRSNEKEELKFKKGKGKS